MIQRGRSCNGLTGDRFIVRAIVRTLGGGTRGWSPEEEKLEAVGMRGVAWKKGILPPPEQRRQVERKGPRLQLDHRSAFIVGFY